MSSGWKPPGYSSVSVYLVVQGGQQVIDLLKKTFEACELRRFDDPDGRIKHAELHTDDTVVMIAEAGGLSVQEPVQKAGDPDRRGGFKDPSGNTWWLSTQMAQPS
jgi:PhnB protein